MSTYAIKADAFYLPTRVARGGYLMVEDGVDVYKRQSLTCSWASSSLPSWVPCSPALAPSAATSLP